MQLTPLSLNLNELFEVNFSTLETAKYSMQLDIEKKIEIWSRAIETQMHFAELSIKMRQIGLTLAGATLALAVMLHQNSYDYSIAIPVSKYYIIVPVSAVLCLGAAGILYAAKIIDVDVYHKMLRGAVRFNEEFEKKMQNDIGWNTGLTETISAYSRYAQPELIDSKRLDPPRWRDGKHDSKNAGVKIQRFYYFSILMLILVSLALVLLESVY